MQSVRRRKASAAYRSPGFFNFVSCASASLILVLAVAGAQEHSRIRSVTIHGNQLVASSTVQGWMETRPGGTFVPSDLQRIDSRYAAEGFPFARVDSVRLVPVDSSLADLVLWIWEGKLAFVSALRLDGMKALSEPIVLAAMRTHVGDRFLPEVLERDIGAVLSLYERTGYPFAKIEVRDISFVDGGDSVGTNILLSVDEGSFARISELRVEGNTTTRAAVIVREARLTGGEVFHGDQPDKVKQRLERMQLFSSVSMPELYVNNNGTVGLLVKVVEGNPNRFDGIVGYIPPAASGESGYLTGLLDVQFRNILGTGRKLSAHWYRENQSSQEIELQYREPWVASVPVNVDVGFAQRKQDSTYIRSTYSLDGELMATDELNLGLVFSSERVVPTEGFGSRVASESHTTSIGVTMSYDSRNDPTTPTGGFSYRTQYQTGVKEVTSSYLELSGNRSSTHRLSFDLEYFLSPFDKQVLALGIYGRDFRSTEVELSDLFRLGGANTLRGYREGQFLGSRIAWSNLEYRMLVGKRSYAFGFVDVGYVQTPNRPEVGLTQEQISRAGYGVGIRLDSPLGLIGVSLAFGQGDTFSTAKLHLRLANEF